jgi:tetratricopeptide (TPR) repeat protein
MRHLAHLKEAVVMSLVSLVCVLLLWSCVQARKPDPTTRPAIVFGTAAPTKAADTRVPVAMAILQIASSMDSRAVLGGDLVSVDRLCHALAPHDRNGVSYNEAAALYEEARGKLEQIKERSDRSADPLINVTGLACEARSSFGQKDDLWAWNEYTIGEALLNLGRSQSDESALKLAVLASLSAAEVFPPSDEGWGWSMYNAGQALRALAQNGEDAEQYRSGAIELLRRVAANDAMPPEQTGYAKLELSNALMDAYAADPGSVRIEEARGILASIEQQEGFGDASREALERLRSLSN